MASQWADHYHFAFLWQDTPKFHLLWYVCCSCSWNYILCVEVQDHRQHWEHLGADGHWIMALEIRGRPPWQSELCTWWWCPQPHDPCPSACVHRVHWLHWGHDFSKWSRHVKRDFAVWSSVAHGEFMEDEPEHLCSRALVQKERLVLSCVGFKLSPGLA